jgi:hypothetical protein
VKSEIGCEIGKSLFVATDRSVWREIDDRLLKISEQGPATLVCHQPPDN